MSRVRLLYPVVSVSSQRHSLALSLSLERTLDVEAKSDVRRRTNRVIGEKNFCFAIRSFFSLYSVAWVYTNISSLRRCRALLYTYLYTYRRRKGRPFFSTFNSRISISVQQTKTANKININFLFFCAMDPHIVSYIQ